MIWQDNDESRHLQRQELRLSYAPERCPVDRPLAVELKNGSDRPLLELRWRIAAYRPGDRRQPGRHQLRQPALPGAERPARRRQLARLPAAAAAASGLSRQHPGIPRRTPGRAFRQLTEGGPDGNPPSVRPGLRCLRQRPPALSRCALPPSRRALRPAPARLGLRHRYRPGRARPGAVLRRSPRQRHQHAADRTRRCPSGYPLQRAGRRSHRLSRRRLRPGLRSPGLALVRPFALQPRAAARAASRRRVRRLGLRLVQHRRADRCRHRRGIPAPDRPVLGATEPPAVERLPGCRAAAGRTPAPAFVIEQQWSLARLFDYMATWSASRLCREAQGNAFVRQALQRVAALWGEPTSTRRVRMPLALRIARKDA